MDISITDYNSPYGTSDTYTYDVNFFSTTIFTTVTRDPTVVSQWISDFDSYHSLGPDSPIVGLDIEWRPFNASYQNPTATLQLCSGGRCLIYQLIHTPCIPRALTDFLSNTNITFVGVGITSDMRRLSNDYGIGGSAKDLGPLASQVYGRNDWATAGLAKLAREILQIEMEKPRNVTMSRWDNRRLTVAQVQYACVDAFVSLEIGIALNACSYY